MQSSHDLPHAYLLHIKSLQVDRFGYPMLPNLNDGVRVIGRRVGVGSWMGGWTAVAHGGEEAFPLSALLSSLLALSHFRPTATHCRLLTVMQDRS